MKVVKTVCNMCSRRCGLDVHIENDKIVKVNGMAEHVFNKLCAKPQAIPELVYHKERLTNPLKKVNGRFKEISWDEAFDIIVDKLTEVKQKYGHKSFMVYFGDSYVRSHVRDLMKRFCGLYGTPNYTHGGSICHTARVIAERLTCGAFITPHFSDATKCMVLWGNNPTGSEPPKVKTISDVAKNGVKLMVVDPVAIPLADKAEFHAQLRPGTDCALALGMLHVIISEGLYDEAFVRDWTVGFEQLAEQVKDYTPEKVEAITWVKADTIRDMARLYATSKPAAVSMGVAMDHSTNGVQAIRAITVLAAITGNLDIPGGNIITPPPHVKSLWLDEKLPEDARPGANHPIFSKFIGIETIVPFIDQMVTEKPYPMKALLVCGANPAVTLPNSNKFRRACENLDFMVAIDIFMTDTVKLADIVLPGVTFLERDELRYYSGAGHSFLTLSNHAIEPIGNARDETSIFMELGRRMGYAEYYPWQNAGEIFEYLLEGMDVTVEQLKQNPGGVYYAEREFQKYLKKGFATPSGKVEIYSELMAEHGYDPIPTFHEPAESPVSCPDSARTYPLLFLSGARKLGYLHSQYRNLPTLRKMVPEPLLEVNPQTAGDLGVADGDMVLVESARGNIELKAKLTRDVPPMVVTTQHGWSEANANNLTEDTARDPVSGYPGFRSVLCKLTRVQR